jgi:FkbM family methyltransferase
MRWIHNEVQPGSVFMDIGANIGIYTIAAAHRVGSNGRVYAFEPHKINAVSLMQNVTLSGLADRVDIFTCPLSDAIGILRFNYASLASASSGSQLGHTRAPGKSRGFSPVASEMMPAVTMDSLIEAGTISPPTLVKIDVDGNELAILGGMRSHLTGPNRPRAIQVEINVGQEEPIGAFLAKCGYRLDEKHFTRPGELKRQRGVPLDQIEYNAIFRPDHVQ